MRCGLTRGRKERGDTVSFPQPTYPFTEELPSGSPGCLPHSCDLDLTSRLTKPTSPVSSQGVPWGRLVGGSVANKVPPGGPRAQLPWRSAMLPRVSTSALGTMCPGAVSQVASGHENGHIRGPTHSLYPLQAKRQVSQLGCSPALLARLCGVQPAAAPLSEKDPKGRPSSMPLPRVTGWPRPLLAAPPTRLLCWPHAKG